MDCYICSQPATSVEHAPAKCFFPTDQRVNLITVPSCAIHNEDTSKEDEYVRNIIAMSIGSNNVGVEHFLKKCIKSFIRSPKLFQMTTGVNRRAYYKEINKEELNPTYIFHIDRERIDFVLRKIAYALYFNKYGTPWNKELTTGTEYLLTATGNDDMGLLIQGAKRILPSPIYEGSNPDVFKYAFLQTDIEDTNEQILIMKFYDGFEAWIFPQPETAGPKLDIISSTGSGVSPAR